MNYRTEEISTTITYLIQHLQLPQRSWDNALEANRLRISPVTNTPTSLSPENTLARYIDHTLLKPDATDDEIDQLCLEAIQYHFASVCVNSCHIARCSSNLPDSEVKICGVVGFPLGAMTTPAKAFEASSIISDGGNEIDMVINIGKLKSNDLHYVYKDIKAICEAVTPLPVKVILETGLLSPHEIITASVISVLAGAAFIKTSTGFGHGGADTAIVQLMREIVGKDFGVKASGGIRDSSTALAMIQAGANRIGASNGVAITNGSNPPNPNLIY